MTAEIELEQKAFRSKIVYRFFADPVEYAIRDRNFNKASFSVEYADSPSKFNYRAFQPWCPMLFGVVLMIMLPGLVRMMSSTDESGDLLGFPAGFGVLAFGVAPLVQWRLKNIYTLIPTRGGNRLVLRGSRYDEGMRELESRRLRVLYELAVIDPLNRPSAGCASCFRLKEAGVIGEQEFKSFRAELAKAIGDVAAPVPLSKPPGEMLH